MSLKKIAIFFLLFFAFVDQSQALLFSNILNQTESRVQEALVQDFEGDELSEILNSLYEEAYELDLRALDLEDLREHADDYIERLFKVQTTLQSELLVKWNRQGLLEEEKTLQAYYKALRTIRYTIDLIGEAKFGFPRVKKRDKVSTAFEDGAFSMVLGGDPNELPSGAIFLVRGSAANSAAIARISSMNDGQFSHIGMLHIDEKGNKSILESLIEKGLVKHAYDYAMNQGVVRAQSFILPDTEASKKAATFGNSLATAETHIDYNFSMELTPVGIWPHKGFFCSDFIAYSYASVTYDETLGETDMLKLPLYPSPLPMTDFTLSIGVTAEKTFIPSDIQSDARFIPGPEWRDFRFTEKVRLHDLILDHMLDALNSKWFGFQSGVKYHSLTALLKLASRTPILKKFSILKDIPRNMTKATLRQVLMLHFTTEKIYKKVSAKNNQHLKFYNLPMSPKQIDQFITELFLSESSFGPFVKLKSEPAGSYLERIEELATVSNKTADSINQCVGLLGSKGL